VELQELLEVGNAAGAIACMQAGVAVISLSELRKQMTGL